MYRKRLCAQFLIILEQIVQLTAKDRPRHPKNSQFPPAFVVSAEDVSINRSEIVKQIDAQLSCNSGSMGRGNCWSDQGGIA
jgi:hypothetical protein